MKRVAIIGASGALGAAFVRAYAARDDVREVYACSRSKKVFDSAKVETTFLDLTDEASIAACAERASLNGPLDVIVVAAGILHQGSVMPEKALRELSAEKFATLFAINTIGPALAAKHFLPRIHRDRRAVFAALSARVGSISDNHLGGWYAYRASKAALNMIIKTASIEVARRAPQAIVVGLHPGTVDSALSKPFQTNVAEGKLFTPDHAAERLIDVLDSLNPPDSGACFAYDGSLIAP
jgi:NAD(P)-dependent dehydrogenase (short-subunit alcohol dehydrogenase family)